MRVGVGWRLGVAWALIWAALGWGGCEDPSVPAVGQGEADASDDASDGAGDAPEADAERDAQDDGGEDIKEPPQGCRPDQCEVDGACFDNLAPNPANPCESCQVLLGREAFHALDGGACEDGDPCTEQDACAGGACVGGRATSCDDGNPCTEDSCGAESGGCGHAPREGACEDGDPCTQGDACQEGACVAGPALDCDDGDPCTDDLCGDGLCEHVGAQDGARCDDGDACTQEDVCSGGACVGGEPLGCDDGSACTADACVQGECVHADLSALCADANPCTAESCDPARGCVFPAVEGSCDDNDACTQGDACQAGACRGQAVELPEGGLCLAVSCDPAQGVQTRALEGACDDDDACTVGDRCEDGGCVAGSEPLGCDDANACTDDACDPAQGCAFTPHTRACDDGDACTVEDACQGGACVPGARLGCDDGNACTTDSCDPAFGCRHALVASFACRPGVVVDHPPRAATLQGQTPEVVVRGSVASGGGAIEQLLINGEPTSVGPDGRFARAIAPQVGGNTLVIEATDALGTTTKVVQSFLWSPTYRLPDLATTTGAVERGMGVYLAREVIDDGDRRDPPDDLGTVFDRILDSYDLNALIPSSLGSVAGLTITKTGVTHGNPSVSLQPQDGFLRLQLSIPDVRIGLRAQGLLFVNATGSVTSPQILVTANVRLRVRERRLEVVLDSNAVTVDIQSPNFSFDSFILDLLVGWLVNIFVPGIVDGLEADFRQTLADELAPLLEDALSALAFDVDLEFPSLSEPGVVIPLRLKTFFQSADITRAGITFGFEAGGFGTPRVPIRNLGALGRAGCLTQGPQDLVIPGSAPFELVLSDDLLNQLFHAAWQGGLLEFDVSDELLGGVDLSQYNVSNLDLHVSGLLQPTASDCNARGEQALHIGDLRVDASMEVLGQPLDVTIYASLQAGLLLGASDSEISIGLTDIESADFEVQIQQEALLGFAPLFEQVVRDNLLPALLGALGGGALGSFPLPAIDLSGAIPDLDEPLFITIAPQEIEREGGNTVVSGDLQ